jgi:hypothetical protein
MKKSTTEQMIQRAVLSFRISWADASAFARTVAKIRGLPQIADHHRIPERPDW